MNWEAAGAIGELLGALAVLATLVYLAVQVRQSKELLEKNERVALSEVYRARLDILACRIELESRPEHIDAVEKYLGSGWESLNNREKRNLQSVALLDSAHQDFNLYQEELGLLDESDNEITKDRILQHHSHWEKLGIKIRPRVRRFYHSHKGESGDA